MIRPRILSVSCNHPLRAARHDLLEKAGFDVTSIGTIFEALELLDKDSFAAVVLGHSFSFTEKQLFAAEVGERWGIPLVVLHSGDTDFAFTGDARVELQDGAAALVNTLKSLTARRDKRLA